MQTHTQEKNKLCDDDDEKERKKEVAGNFLSGCRTAVCARSYNTKIGRSRTTGKNSNNG